MPGPRISPSLLAACGLGLIVGGFFYDAIFAGIPYQDPTPAMVAKYRFHSRIASTLLSGGVVLLPAGLMWSLCRRKRHDGPNEAAGGWNWRRLFVALLVAYAACSLVTALVFVTSSVCPGSSALQPLASVLILPAIPLMGSFVAALIVLTLYTSSLFFALLGSVLLIGLGAVLALSAVAALRPTEDGGWPLAPILIFLLSLAGLSAISTIVFCGSLTA